MRKKSVIAIGFIISMLLATPKVLAIEPTNPHPANAIWTEPAVIDISQYSIGDKFNITVFVNSSATSGGWQFWLIYPSTYINATGRIGYTAGSKSEFFQGLTTMPVAASFKDYNATHKRIDFGETIISPPYRDPGYGSLAWIEFEVINLPENTVYERFGFLDVGGTGTYILDSTGQKPQLNVYPSVIVPEFTVLSLALLTTMGFLSVFVLKKKRKK